MATDDDWLGLLPEDELDGVDEPPRSARAARGGRRERAERPGRHERVEGDAARSGTDGRSAASGSGASWEDGGLAPSTGSGSDGAGSGSDGAGSRVDGAGSASDGAGSGPSTGSGSESDVARSGEATTLVEDRETGEETPQADTGRGGRRSGRTWLLVGGVAAVLVLVLAGAAFGPQIARNLSTSVVAVDTAVTLTDAGDSATVTAPAGWHVVRPIGADGEVALETPDGLVEIALRLTHRADGGPQPGPVGTPDDLEWLTEHPTEHLTAIYAHVEQPANLSTEQPASSGVLGPGLFADGSPAHPGVVATIAPEPPAASGAVVDVTVTSDVPVDPYLGEFAAIVESLEFGS